MGAQQSKAESYVDHLIDVGIEVFNQTTSSAWTPYTGNQWIIIKGCHGLNISDVSFDQRYTLNLSMLSESITKGNMDAAIKDKISQEAKATAAGGIGIQDADSQTIAHVVDRISEALKTTTESIAKSPVDATQMIYCEDSDNINVVRVNFKQAQDLVIKSISQSDAVLQAKADSVAEIEADAEATAKGWDPSLLLLIALAVGLVIFLLISGVSGGMIAKPTFWLLLAVLGTALCGYLAISPLIGWWPGKTVNPDKDSEKEIAYKKHHNRNLELYSGLTAGGCLLVTLGLGYLTFRRGAPSV